MKPLDYFLPAFYEMRRPHSNNVLGSYFERKPGTSAKCEREKNRWQRLAKFEKTLFKKPINPFASWRHVEEK